MITLKIDTKQKHRISPYIYMQFMEPLGVHDGSMDCGFDFRHDRWNPVFMEKVKKLSPTMVRFGGCFASYYHWREGVGPKKDRKLMMNYCWDAPYHNLMGTHEVMDFCKQTDAEPLMVVNMESDFRPHWSHPENDSVRFGTDIEAADWVSYCNDPDNAERLAHGVRAPYNIRYWQIGNETSYFKELTRSSAEAAEVTRRFACKMRERDNGIKLIGWGDEGSQSDGGWCREMAKVDELDLIAFHHHFNSGLDNSPLFCDDYLKDPDNTWRHLMHAHNSLQTHIDKMRADCGNKRLAITEGHFSIKASGRNANPVLATWGAGVAYARCLNVIHRNSDIVDIATMADFFGNRWQVNAIMIKGMSEKLTVYFQPVATVMSLFRHHQGEYALDIESAGTVDAVASRTGNKIFLHLANTDCKNSVRCKLDIGEKIKSVRMYGVASEHTVSVSQFDPDVFEVTEMPTDTDSITLPPCAVTAVEIEI